MIVKSSKMSGIRLKTARVSVSGIPEEAMSFQNIDWIELYENDKWEDSVLYQLFTSRFLFVTFKKVTEYNNIHSSKNKERG